MAKTKKETATSSPPKAALTAAQLERMTTHELAEMLSNVVLLLRRMPDVPCEELVGKNSSSPLIAPPAASVLSAPTAVENQHESDATSQRSLQQRIEDLGGKKYTVQTLKAMADELGIPYPVNPKKADLAKRIAERQMRGHSEQYAMMNL